MAGFLENIITTKKNKTNSYIEGLLKTAKNEFGENSSEYNGIYNQYFRIPVLEKSSLTNRRHYEAEISDTNIKGLERLYKRSVVIDLLSACACECIYCLRGYYEKFALTTGEIKQIVEYCSKEPELREVLITGGDPFIATHKLKFLITELASKAPNIKIIRIGTRLPVMDPFRFDQSIYLFFESLKNRFIFEISCQINHYFELQEKPKEIILQLQKSGCRLYSQNVLLRGVNDSLDVLVRLYDELRYLGVLPHYLFHAVPMKGTDEFRTSVQKGLYLIRRLTSGGQISGRAKPQYALMTDIGKVTLYQDTIIGKDDNYLVIKTEYKFQDRKGWNPSYKLPPTAFENENGTLNVKYLDGTD